MKTSQFGLWFIESMEGRRLTSYPDVKGIPTIGVGHTGPDVTLGLTWTPERVEEVLAQDVEKAELAVNSLEVDLTGPQFDALVSLTFNIGANAFATSTVATELRKSRYLEAARVLLLWNSHGKLTDRRWLERGIFLYGTKP